jgi:hypothetical protein
VARICIHSSSAAFVLLPQIGHAPPALQIVKQGLDPPALGVDLDDLLGREVGLGGQNQAWARPRVVGQEHLAPHPREPGSPFRNRATAKTERTRTGCTLPYSISSISCIGKVSSIAASTPLAVLALPPSAFRFGLGREKQGGISPHLPDDADLLFEQGQNQAAAHEPGIDQQAHPPSRAPGSNPSIAVPPRACRAASDSSSSQERIGTVSAEPSRTRTTKASVTQHWLFKNVGRLALCCDIVFDADPPAPNFAQRGTSVSSRIRVTSSVGHTLSTSCNNAATVR